MKGGVSRCGSGPCLTLKERLGSVLDPKGAARVRVLTLKERLGSVLDPKGAARVRVLTPGLVFFANRDVALSIRPPRAPPSFTPLD